MEGGPRLRSLPGGAVTVVGRFLSSKGGRYLAVLAALTSLSSSCSGSRDDVTKECLIPNDQKGTIGGRWTVKPVPLAVIVNDFSAVEMNELRAAIGTWNSFFSASKGFKLFVASGAPLSSVPAGTPKIRTNEACSVSSFVTASGFVQPILIEKIVSGWTHGGSVIAQTGTCPNTVQGQPYRVFSTGVIEMNFENYFAPGLPRPDLQSVILHELGHLLGLGHTCEAQAQKNFLACAEAPKEYLQAVMFPSLGFDGNTGRIKRSLQQNDQQRANCLY